MIVAVDSEFLLRLADVEENAWNIYSLLLERDRPYSFVATPTAVDRLEYLSQLGDEKNSVLAFRAWKALDAEWKIKTVFLSDSQRKLSWMVGYHLRQTKIVSEKLQPESDLIAEATLSADLLLVSDNSPLYKIDYRDLALEIRLLGLSPVIICTPGFLSRKLSD